MNGIGAPGNSTPTASSDASPMSTELLIRRTLELAESLGDKDLYQALLLATSLPHRGAFLTLLQPPAADVNSRCEDGPGSGRVFMCPDLYEAATSGDIALMLELLLSTVDYGVHGPCRLSEVTAERNTVLHLAAGHGHSELAAEACRRESSLLVAENSRGDTPLHCAARNGRHSLVSLLLLLAEESGVGAFELLTKKNRLGDTVLHEAVRNGHGEVAEVLMIAAPNLASVDNEDGVSPLYLAVMNGAIPLVESLIRCDHASFAGPKGQTALHAAVLSNRNIASMLLKWKPATAQEVDASGSTPLHYAASGDDTKIVQMLLNASTSATYSKDTEGFSPIHVAARVGNVKTIKLLLKTCPDSAELLDNRGRNFLHLAAEKRRKKVVEYVLKHGKELEKLINEQDFEGNTPLHLAVESENSLIALAFTKDGRTQKSMMNKEGQTPLELASKITRFLPLASIVLGLIYSRALFSVRRQDRVEPWNRVGGKWYDSVSKNLAIVAVLVATVAFSATFNVPGGYDNSDGKATLHGQARFKFFMAFDSMAMALSLVSTILLILVRAVDARDRWLIFITGIFTLWLSIFCMNMAFMVAAISAGLAKSIEYVLYVIFYSPGICIMFLDSTAIDKVLGRILSSAWKPERRPTRYTKSRAKQQYKDVFSLVTGLTVVLILSYLSTSLLSAVTSLL